MSGKRTTLVAVLLLALTGCQGVLDGQLPTSSSPQQPPAANSGQAGEQLAGLTIAAEGKMAGYSRDRFPHWAGQGNSCDTREVVLREQGAGVQTDDECKATTGTWVSAYDGVEVTKAGDLDIDHTVPLAEAWRSGADKWDDEKRKAFANDLGGVQLIAVTAKTNRAKGDQDPAKWMPPKADYACTYVAHWIQVKAQYALTVDQAEHDALASTLAGC
ncbi:MULTISPECIES: HNH endonuclease family protein [Actinosynnema]|uniref:HNH endonuclease family protein n=1 Tax=Actinosynnema TaxID=40566 RepID=UPI0020A480AC|nr:HNH endonuclease family protein [Actinosynnema pretiosum]MCP2092893.1 Protein of unknown function (DUF1524) [Actinosynnema pretiosum]